MINDFKDFCTWMYVVTDDIWLKIAPFFKRPGPRPECPDSELLAMAIIGECRGWDVETEMLSQWQEYRDLFPVIPTQSRFNRRRRGLMQAFNLIRQVVLQCLDIAQDRQCVIDSLPLPVTSYSFTLYRLRQPVAPGKPTARPLAKCHPRNRRFLGINYTC